MMPTASAVVGDLIDVVTGRALLTSRVLNLWSDRASPGEAHPARGDQEPVLPPVHHCRPAGRARRDRPVLGEHGISIASVIQHDPGR